MGKFSLIVSRRDVNYTLNLSVRTQAVKYLETVILLQTYTEEDSMKKPNEFSLDDVPMALKVAKRRRLEDEAV
jgi:symplekin